MSKPLLSIPYLVAITYGVIYGVICQLTIRLQLFADSTGVLTGVMSFGFVFILPFVLGFLTLLRATPEQRSSWRFRIFAPQVTILASLLVSVLVGWEGAICLIMAAVIYLPLGSIGGIVTGIILTRMDKRKLHSSWLALVLSLPMLSAYLEHHLELPIEYRRTENEILIQAPPEVVWSNIIRVRPITEPLDGFFYKMGFPKPIEATLSKEGVGGVRKASFERGLLFIETVDEWVPLQKLSFSIESDPTSIPPTTLDEHVTVGGRYFDVLRGTYEIVPLTPQSCILKLSSKTRISTRFNFYAGWWAQFLMSDIQRTILAVIRTRSEADMNTSPVATDTQ